jgi:glycerol-3-phosphate O-acyltransferase
VNLDEPIALAGILDRHEAQWRTRLMTTRAAPGGRAVDELAIAIMQHQLAAVVTPVNLLALALLAMPARRSRAGPARQVEMYRALLAALMVSACRSRSSVARR